MPSLPHGLGHAPDTPLLVHGTSGMIVASDRPWFAVRRELSRPQNEPQFTVLGRINGYVTETVHYFFYCGLTGPPIQKNPTPTPMTPDAAVGLGGVVR